MSRLSFQDQVEVADIFHKLEGEFTKAIASLLKHPDVYSVPHAVRAIEHVEIGFMLARKSLFSHDATKVKRKTNG
jgi:hypothetical protein